MTNQEILQATLNKYGDPAQLQKAQEECEELINALYEYIKAPSGTTLDHVIEELVDVGIMQDQLVLCFERYYGMATIQNKIKEWQDKKIKRMEEAL